MSLANLLLPDDLQCDEDGASQESLGSWLHRLTQANGMVSIRTVLKTLGISAILTEMPLQLEEAIRRLEEETGADPRMLRSLHMAHVLAAKDKGSMNKGSSWLFKSPTFSLTRKRHLGLRHMVCPECISQSQIPHWKIGWRLTWNTHCESHRLLLLDACTSCDALFVIKPGGQNSLTECVDCGLHLSRMNSRVFPARSDADVNGRPTNTAEQPASPLDGRRWLDGARKLITLIEDPHRAAQLSKASMPLEHRELLTAIASDDRCSFDEWPAELRYGALCFIEWLREPWPDRLASLLREAGLGWRGVPCLTSPAEHWVAAGLASWSPGLRDGHGA